MAFNAAGLKEIRQRRGVTRENLGDAVGRSAESVRQWELGRCEPKERVLPLIARHLGVSIETLLGLD